MRTLFKGLISLSFVAVLAISGNPPAFAAPPAFEDYPAGPMHTGKRKQPDLKSHKNARTFRTRLRDAVDEPRWFAGHLTVMEAGCGSGCQVYMLVDVKTGKVYEGPTTSLGAVWKPESRLFIANPPEEINASYVPGNVPDWLKTEYWVWKNGKFAQLKSGSSGAKTAGPAPAFDDYPAGPVYKGKRKPPNLKSHKMAGTFRTRLRDAVKEPRWFAGHLTVMEAGCGTGCQIYMFVDVKTGKVYEGPTTSLGAEWKPGSRLFIANPPEEGVSAAEVPEYARPQYWLWDKGKLKRLNIK